MSAKKLLVLSALLLASCTGSKETPPGPGSYPPGPSEKSEKKDLPPGPGLSWPPGPTASAKDAGKG